MRQLTFADRTRRYSSSAVRDILKRTMVPDMISFAGGLPADEWFPREALQEAYARIFRDSASTLQYGITDGYTPLREQLCNWMLHKGVSVQPDQMLLTTGSQQAIDLAARIWLNPGDVVITESPTYLAALQVFQAAEAKVIGIPSDEDGMDLARLQEVMEQVKPKLLYVSPTFANPTGKCWSKSRKQALLDLCQQNELTILEDDPYGELTFESGTHMESLLSMSGELDMGSIMYTSTFSKTVVPALRTGWVIANRAIIQEMSKAKQACDLHSSLMDQQALNQLMRHYDLRAHIAQLREGYKERMQVMAGELQALAGPMSPAFEIPKGGMFIWVNLNQAYRTDELLSFAIEEGVAFVPGSSFYPDAPNHQSMRLNFSHSSPERIREGMQRLRKAMDTYARQGQSLYHL
ncbi:aminotransferase-like domain-containing protein [Marinicrinis sediminis]|uniref:PLP-dependent aminotransferase family protein n=1 Tax=Marinicrinis sediminis TaxID=1652465 RepID=A0ABW5REW0_9BACL